MTKKENLVTLDLDSFDKKSDELDNFNNQIDEPQPLERIESFDEFRDRIFNNFEAFFINYLKLFFRVTEGRELKENWHLHLIGYNVRKILMQKSYRDIWNMSPGSAKSSISIAFATLYIGFYPNTRTVVFSGTQSVRDKYAVCIRKMLENKIGLNIEEDGVIFPSYQELFPNVRISEERNRQEEFYIKDKAGSFRILSLGSDTTGLDIDLLIVDDPIDYMTMKTQGFKYIEKVNSIVLYLFTRLREIGNEKKPALVIMQRMCEGDTTECLITTQTTVEWNNVIIPAKENRRLFRYMGQEGMLYEYYNKNPIFRQYGQIYMEGKDEKWLVEQKNKLNGSNIDFEYQFFQTSTGEAQNVLSVGKIKQYISLDYSKSYTKILSVDTATGTEGKDANAIALFLMDEEANLFLHRMYFNHYEYGRLRDFIERIIEEELIDIVLIEDKTVGRSLIQDLEKSYYGFGRPLTEKERRICERNPRNRINAIKTPTSKEFRAAESNTFIESGKLYFPSEMDINTELKDELNKNCLDLLLYQLKSFPNLAHDDGVDVVTQAINYVKARFAIRKEKSFKNKIYTL